MLQFWNLDDAWLLYLAQLGIFWNVNETDWKDCRGLETPLQTPLPRAVWRSALCTTRGLSGSLPNRNPDEKPNTNIQYLCHHTRAIHKQAMNPQTQHRVSTVTAKTAHKTHQNQLPIRKGGRGGSFPRG